MLKLPKHEPQPPTDDVVFRHSSRSRAGMQKPPASGVPVSKPSGSTVQPSASAGSVADMKWGSKAIFRKKEESSPALMASDKDIKLKDPAISRDKKEKKDKKHDDDERRKEGKDKEKKLKKGHSMNDLLGSPGGGRSSARFLNLKEVWAAPTTSLLMRDQELIRNVALKLNEGV